MKITKREIKQLAYEEYKKIILEAASKEDTSADDMKYDKIQKLYDLGQKIKQQADNSFTHLEAFLSLGLKVRDTFEFKRATVEISRIQKLINDMNTVIIRAHEIAEEPSEVSEVETDSGSEYTALRKKGLSHDDAMKKIKNKKEPEEDDAEVLNKRPDKPDMKHAYEQSNDPNLQKFNRAQISIEKEADKKFTHNSPEWSKYVDRKMKEFSDNNQDDVMNHALEAKHPMSTVRPVPSKKTLKDLGAVKVKKKPVKKEEVDESIDFVKDAEGKPVRVRDRVIQKAFDPKAKTYKWSMMDKYRVEKILSPDKILVHDFNSEKDFSLNPSQLKRIGIEHLYEEEKLLCPDCLKAGKKIQLVRDQRQDKEHKGKYVCAGCNKSYEKTPPLKEYGAVIVNKYDEKNVITEDVKAKSIKEAIRILGIKYPANAFKITNLIEGGDEYVTNAKPELRESTTCTNCNHSEDQHDSDGYCTAPNCQCTKFES